MIVGNGDIGEAEAGVIDAADFVIRFNDCRSYGAGGSRTDAVAVCNTGRPAKAMLGSREWRAHPGVVSAGEIWSVRDPEKFAAMRAPLAVSHPELDDFCDDYTAEFSAFCADTGKTNVVISKSVHEAVDASLSAFSPAPYVVPSSGMIIIAEVLNTYAEAEATLAGFGHVGWEWHPFSAERQLVDSYIAAGRLKRLGGETLVSSSQGA
ncbi:Urease operon accessory protein [Rhizobium laguerreae]|uniref:Urease operon accessory protein n=1 Tax=Rhizobium laguerreae TaxID=1076926 RepID=UPI001C9089E9|nr:Urease operon accessory protein [Rhizobium laguerreae]MBY3208035.1 Urease operon accessory protein [Rhizobium laguerreae]MBY3342312.1 Urease operon accessory protein [Rhizobium laguerreae]MBY3349347.1 Urease operon accessory protein [Rhizobium laguerreae]MBY3370450.1 Urease operon accessory protein [Rhizobium laguerreae]MBY3425690.1 Urease operon accessory protein [Rhizobium laguerreae]